MLSRDLVTCQLLDVFLGPREIVSSTLWGLENVETYISPIATMQIVCQTLNPILGATPLYKPLIPFWE